MNAQRESAFTMDGHFGQECMMSESPSAGLENKNNVVTLSKSQIPRWFSKTTESLYAILGLDDDWDSYGAKRFSSMVAMAVDRLLQDVMHFNTPPPQVVPVANGNIQIEWHFGGIDLEIEVVSCSIAHVFFQDKSGKEPEWDGEVSDDLTKLVRYINLLTAKI